MAGHSEEMGWRRGGWRASLTSFSPSVDSVTHPRTGTQMKRTSPSVAVISNKRMIMALVKTPPTLLGLLSHGQRSHLAQSHLTWIRWSNLSISILRRHSAITHPSLPIISSFGQALWLTKPSGPWRRMSESARIQTCTRAFIYVHMSERDRESGRWVLMYIWAGRTIVRLHFY